MGGFGSPYLFEPRVLRGVWEPFIFPGIFNPFGHFLFARFRGGWTGLFLAPKAPLGPKYFGAERLKLRKWVFWLPQNIRGGGT